MEFIEVEDLGDFAENGDGVRDRMQLLTGFARSFSVNNFAIEDSLHHNRR